ARDDAPRIAQCVAVRVARARAVELDRLAEACGDIRAGLRDRRPVRGRCRRLSGRTSAATATTGRERGRKEHGQKRSERAGTETSHTADEREGLRAHRAIEIWRHHDYSGCRSAYTPSTRAPEAPSALQLVFLFLLATDRVARPHTRVLFLDLKNSLSFLVL